MVFSKLPHSLEVDKCPESDAKLRLQLLHCSFVAGALDILTVVLSYMLEYANSINFCVTCAILIRFMRTKKCAGVSLDKKYECGIMREHRTSFNIVHSKGLFRIVDNAYVNMISQIILDHMFDSVTGLECRQHDHRNNLGHLIEPMIFYLIKQYPMRYREIDFARRRRVGPVSTSSSV
jgi:hypothetical protein